MKGKKTGNKKVFVAIKLPEVVVGSTKSVVLKRIGVSPRRYGIAKGKSKDDYVSVNEKGKQDFWFTKEDVEVLKVKGRGKDGKF